MTHAKLTLIFFKSQDYYDYYFTMPGRKGTIENIVLQNVLSSIVNFVEEPTKENRYYAKKEFMRFLKLFEKETE